MGKPIKFKITKDKTGDGYSCQYCKANVTPDTGCLARMENYMCCRVPGHKGNHVACGTDKGNHSLLVWKGTRIIKRGKHA